MFGSIISGIIKVATLPIDVAEAAVDVVIADGDGSKKSRQRNDVGFVSKVRDGVCDAVEEAIDE
jgi:hypothetical protein